MSAGRAVLCLPLCALLGCATGTPDKGPDDDDDDDVVDVDAKVIIIDGPDARPVAPDPDARPVAPDPDAAPLPPDIDAAPGPCTTTVVQLLGNPSFDLGPGSGWIESSGGGFPIVVAEGGGADQLPAGLLAQSPLYAAWMGGYFDGVDILYQQVTVPANATAVQISGYTLIGSEETVGFIYDTMRITIRDSSGVELELLGDGDGDGYTFTNSDLVDVWTPFAFNAATALAGRTVLIDMEGSFDSTLNTNFFFDTYAVRATVCM